MSERSRTQLPLHISGGVAAPNCAASSYPRWRLRIQQLKLVNVTLGVEVRVRARSAISGH